MFYKNRELRRLWRIYIYDGDKEDPECPIREETLVAWNAVDAIRRCGQAAARQPEEVCFVSWPDDDAQAIQRVANPLAGPVGDVVVPSIAVADKEAW